MKKTDFSIYALVAVLSLVLVTSCGKEIFDNGEPSGSDYMITAIVSNPSEKTTIDGMTPKWSVGDKIYIYDSSDPARNKIITLGTDATIAPGGGEFHFPHPEGFSSNICAVYPASAFSSVGASGPDLRYDAQDGTFATANISTATANSEHVLFFYNKTAILRFSAISDPRIAAISIPEASVGVVTLSSAIGTGPVYIAVPPMKFPCGSSFLFLDSSGVKLGAKTITAESGNTVNVNKIYNLGPAEL